MVDARSFNFGCSMPDARWSSDARCPMHGELRMPDGRCTRNFSFPLNQRKPKRFEQTSFLGKQKTSLCGKDQHFKRKCEKRKEIDDISKEAKKKSNFYYKEQQIVIRLFSLLNYHSCDNIVEKLLCDNIVEKLKTGNNFNQTIFWRRLNFRRKKIIRLVGTKSFLRHNFRRKKIIRFVGTKKFFET